MNLKPMRCEQAGRFRLEVSGGKRGYKDFGWQDNLILDAGIQRLLSTNGSVLLYISVGSGTSTPSVGQTQLDSKIAHTNRSPSYTHGYNSEGGYGWTKFSCQFAQGTAAGNVGELGVGWDGTNLWSRALVLNAQNEPTTITVLSDEYLTVTYELRSWWIVPEPYEVDVMEEIGGVPTVVETVTVTHAASIVTPNSEIGIASARFNRYEVPFRGGSDGSSAGPSASWGDASNGVVEWSLVVPIGVANGSGGIVRIDSEGNAQSGSLYPMHGRYAGDAVITFSPRIPKTNEYEVTITGTLTMGRKS